MRRMLLIKSAISLILIAIVLFGVGIFLTLELGIFLEPEQSILTDRPCAPPCWYGIIPGETQRDPAWNALKQNPYVRQSKLDQHSYGDKTDFTWFNRHTRGIPSRVYLRGDTAQIIEVESESSIKLGDVISKLGNPEKVLAWYDVTPEDPSKSYWIQLYFPRRGVVVSTQMAPNITNGQSPIYPEMAVTELTYFTPTSLDALFDIERSFTSVNAWNRSAQERLQDWRGFGLYAFPIDPP